MAKKSDDAGDVTAAQRAADFEAFVREQRSALAGFLRRRLPTEEDAQDVAQESLLRMLRYGKTEPPQDWKPLLYRVATNAAHDHARRRATHRSEDHVPLDSEDVELVCDRPLPEQVAEQQEELAMLEKAILDLAPRCRQVFLLHRVEGMTYGEIGKHFGISRSMVKKYISRAIVALAAVSEAYARASRK